MSAKKDITAIEGLSVQEIEQLAAQAYRQRGYEPHALGSELLLTRGEQRLMLQCKHWKTRKVGEMPVRELYGMMAAHLATGGVIVSSGAFTLEATRFAGFGGIELLDASRFKALLQQPPNESAAAAIRPLLAARV